jgi:hypothetical protein
MHGVPRQMRSQWRAARNTGTACVKFCRDRLEQLVLAFIIYTKTSTEMKGCIATARYSGEHRMAFFCILCVFSALPLFADH